MKAPTQNQTLIGLAMAILTAATGYLGYEKVQSSPSVTVNVEAPDIKPIINRAISQAIINHKQNDH